MPGMREVDRREILLELKLLRSSVLNDRKRVVRSRLGARRDRKCLVVVVSGGGAEAEVAELAGNETGGLFELRAAGRPTAQLRRSQILDVVQVKFWINGRRSCINQRDKAENA